MKSSEILRQSHVKIEYFHPKLDFVHVITIIVRIFCLIIEVDRILALRTYTLWQNHENYDLR